MTITVHSCSPALAGFVSSIGYFEGRFDHTRERALPAGTTQLLVNLDADEFHSYATDGRLLQRTGGAVVQGPYARPTLIDPAEQRAVLWVGFRPGAAYPFFAAPASATRDQFVALDALWGRDGAVLRERLLAIRTPAEKLRAVEAMLLARARLPSRRDPGVVYAVRALHRGVTVAEVTDRLGWTAKRLARAFHAQVGLTPKRFARVRRFQRLIASIPADATPGAPVDATPGATADCRSGATVDWARLATECGYHDQAHMIHDFQAFSGLSPTRYAPRSPGEHNHVPVADGTALDGVR